MKKIHMKNAQLVTECLVETLTILSHESKIDADVALNFINNKDLQGLKHYLEAVRKKG